MNILLIEDNENISDGLKYSLEKEKYHVMVCANIEDTIKYLEENKSCNESQQWSKDLIGVYDLIKRLLEKEGKLYGYYN